MKDHQKSIGGAQEHEGSVDAVFSVKETDEVGGAVSFSFFPSGVIFNSRSAVELRTSNAGVFNVVVYYYVAGGGGTVLVNETMTGPGGTAYLYDLPAYNGKAGHFELVVWQAGNRIFQEQYFIFMSDLPVIDDALVFNNAITGTGGDATDLSVWIPSSARLSERVRGVNNRWSIPLASAVHPGTFEITVEQYVNRYQLRYSSIKRITYLTYPRVDTPANNGVVKLDTVVPVNGTWGASGELIQVMNQNGTVNYGEVTAGTDGRWGITFNAKHYYPNGGLQIINVRHEKSGNAAWAQVSVLFLAPPTIDAGPSLVETDVTIVGAGHTGITGCSVGIYPDLSDSNLGSGPVINGRWSVNVKLIPGARTLTAIQFYGGLESDRAATRTVHVRPPALTTVNVETPSDTTVKFSGTGHAGATVQITLVSGPGGTAPPSVVVKSDGQWETSATDWPLGVYTLKAIQKVSDNANGWIESNPYSFTVNRQLKDPTELQYTKDYQPTFSGLGHTGATVTIANPGGSSSAAPDARVANGRWSSKASEVWGPTLNRKVHIRQSLNGQWSPSWLELAVSIPPLAPVISQVDVDGFFVVVSGTCWTNAVVELTFSDSGTTFPAQVTDTRWSFRRDTPFEPDITHTVTVTQTAAGQTSPAASETFLVEALIPQPVITEPAPGAEVDRDITVRGEDGLKGATMQLRDAQFGGALGEPKVLADDGGWSINLTALEFREYIIDAQQTFDGRESLRSEMRTFNVVVVPPAITVPVANQNLPRTSMLEGRATPGGSVDVWLEGEDEPLLKNITVGADGRWYAEVTLPVGRKTIWARQTFQGQQSKNSQPLTYNVVPAAPSIETPATDEEIGRQTVVSGFGVPGDTVTLKLVNPALTVLGRSPVLEDRTWSVSVEFDQPAGRYGVVAVASCDGFDSADSPARPVVLRTYLPTIELPAAGSRVSHPVGFKGLGAQGVGEVMSWFNPDLKWAVNIPVAGGWQAVAMQPLSLGGQWCRFKQTITDGAEGASDWVESKRFEVAPATSGSERERSDERS
ncbi:MAG: hypothetical protein ABWZ65_11355 [Pseudomonas mandelii]